MDANALSATAFKVHENKLRRMAARQGLQVVKARRIDPRAIDYGTYSLADPDRNVIVAGPGLDVEELERALLEPDA